MTCTGGALVTIAPDASGAPVETTQDEPAPCVAAAPPSEGAGPQDWRRLATAIPGPVRADPAPHGPILLPYRKREPPPPV